jgi:hypothetical protein
MNDRVIPLRTVGDTDADKKDKGDPKGDLLGFGPLPGSFA